MNLKALGNKVLIRPKAAESTTEGGIVLAQSAQEKPLEGTVLSVGAGCKLSSDTHAPLAIEIGNTVVYSRYGGQEIREGREALLLIDENSVLAVRVQ